MPNHVTTRCIVTGDAAEVERFKVAHFIHKMTEPGEYLSAERKAAFKPEPRVDFDFNTIIPMPEILRGSDESSMAQLGAALIMYRASSGAPFADHAEFWTKSVREDVGDPQGNITAVAAAYLAKHPDCEAAGMTRLQAIVQTGYASWYPWAVANWATKWGAYSLSIVDESPLQFTFETAWSFPTPIFKKLALEYPSLTFRCATYDEGSNFAGVGCFNGDSAEAFGFVEATPDLYRLAYGREPDPEEEDEAA